MYMAIAGRSDSTPRELECRANQEQVFDDSRTLSGERVLLLLQPAFAFHQVLLPTRTEA